MTQELERMLKLEELRLSYPRVSEIIGKQTEKEMRAIPVDALVNAALRGTKVHGYCTSYLKDLWIPEIEDEYVPYVNAFKRWADENIEETLFTNERLYDDERRFTGEYDCIVILKDSKRTAMLDIKTSANVSKSWPIQLAAYKHLCELNGYPIETVLNIHLKKTKAAIFDSEKRLYHPAIVKPFMIEYEDITKYWSLFASALSCYDYFERKEKD